MFNSKIKSSNLCYFLKLSFIYLFLVKFLTYHELRFPKNFLAGLGLLCYKLVVIDV